MTQISKPSDINKIWASGGDVLTPSDTKIATGWQVEIPPRQYFNYIDQKQDTAIAHINQHGIAVWDAVTEYQANKSYVQGSNGVVYKALTTNTSNDPVIDGGTNWQVAFIDISSFVNSKTSNGYQKIAGGFVIQWGSVIQNANTSVTYSFPTAFPTSCAAMAANKGTMINLTGEYTVGSQAISTTQFTIANTGSGASQGIFWIAVGY